MTPSGDLTTLIARTRAGDEQSYLRLYELAYHEIRSIARRHRHVGRQGDTMQPTALANEAFLLLHRRFGQAFGELDSSSRAFYLVVAQAMREILRNHWKSRRTGKRGGGQRTVPLPMCDSFESLSQRPDDFSDLDAAIERLREFNSDWHDVFMLRAFAILTVDEVSNAMGISPSTVKDRWRLGRAWLSRELERRGRVAR